MNNKTRKIAALAGTAVMAMGMLAGCGSGKSTSVAGTYTYELAPEALAGTTEHNGYVSALGVSQKNTLELTKDGKYSYTKQVASFDADGNAEEGNVNLVFTFTGSYTSKDDTVTLNTPDDCEFNEDWAMLNGQGLNSSSGKASAGDKVECKEDQSHDPLDFFLTEYYLDSKKHDGNVEVNVDTKNGSFTYAEVANSDDE